jgi:hypothetical protein
VRIVYVAHPLGDGPDRARNLLNAARWCAYFAARHTVAPAAPWIVLASIWDESRRHLGLRIDLAIVARCDELWMCGGRVSPGMKLEADHARQHGIPVRDFTAIGYDPPSDCDHKFVDSTSCLKWCGVHIDELRRTTRIELEALQVQQQAPEGTT